VDDNLNHTSSFSSVAFTLLSHNVTSLWYASMSDAVDNCKNCLLLTFSSITSIFAMTYVVVTWYNSSLWLAATPRQVHNVSKSKLHYFDLLWTCWFAVYNKSYKWSLGFSGPWSMRGCCCTNRHPMRFLLSLSLSLSVSLCVRLRGWLVVSVNTCLFSVQSRTVQRYAMFFFFSGGWGGIRTGNSAKTQSPGFPPHPTGSSSSSLLFLLRRNASLIRHRASLCSWWRHQWAERTVERTIHLRWRL